MELKTTLNEEMTKRFQTVKKRTGIKDDKNVLGFLISEEYDRILMANHRKLLVANETYALLEKEAEARGQTVDEYIEELIEKQIKKTEEGASHAD
jgi:hypothetical protein